MRDDDLAALLRSPALALDVASDDLSRLFPDATSEVVPLVDLAGGTVYTYFRGGQWCTVSKRTGPPNTTCAGSLPATGVRPFAFLRGPGTESLTVDRDYVVAGLLGDRVASVEVELVDGRVLRASTVRSKGFPREVWFQDLAPDDRVTGYTAGDAGGAVLGTVTAVDAVLAQQPTSLPGPQALADTAELLTQIERLRGGLLGRLADVERRKLHHLDGASSTSSWIDAQQTSLDRGEVALARRMSGLPRLEQAAG